MSTIILLEIFLHFHSLWKFCNEYDKPIKYIKIMKKISEKCFDTALFLILLCFVFAVFEDGFVLTVISAIFASASLVVGIIWMEYESENE